MYRYVLFFFSDKQATVCEYQEHTLECLPQQNIVIKNAEYGHIGISECIEVETRYFGCKVDISNLLEKKCPSSSCTIDANAEEIRKLNPCRKGLVVYIKMSYMCIDGE